MNNSFMPSIFKKLDECDNILLSGCGGGYDIFCALPLYFYLKNLGKKVSLASLSFTDFDNIDKNSVKMVGDYCYIINKSIKFNKSRLEESSDVFSPEYYLSTWFDKVEHQDVGIYSFPLIGPKLLKSAYQDLWDEIRYDCVILVDGGTDSLIQGDESGIGTFIEDLSSILSIGQLNIRKIKHRILISLGFGIDAYHGVKHYDILSNISDLIKSDGFLGCFTLEKDMQVVKKYISAIEFANKSNPQCESIVQNSILSALYGKFGNYPVTENIKGNRLFINPLMSQIWCFDVSIVCDSLKVTPTMSIMEDMKEMEVLLAQQRDNKFGYSSKRLKIRPARNIPI
ncbi:MAG: DUF1152 domain-containing protein [Candidatus Lokiarchaeota archaeon]|nr:DUF1152 domain-containing protein [Candidatus Lokiarchaeota archaeon]